MGIFKTRMEVGNLNGGELMQVEALVDTGSLHSMIPESAFDELDLQPESLEEFQLADGTMVEYPVGAVRIKVAERSMICPVIFGPDDQYILGATSLETLGFAVDPSGETLVRIIRRARPF